MIPKRRKPQKLGVRQEPQIRSAGHLQFIRGFQCSCEMQDGQMCSDKVEAAHVRTGTDGGTALKPSDCWTIPLCSAHHAIQHNIGEREFERQYRIDMKAIAKALWARSPHAKKLTRTDA